MTDTSRPGAYLSNGQLFFRLPDGSTILCKCIGEPFARTIVEMWNARSHPAFPMYAFPENWRSRCATGEEFVIDNPPLR